MKSVAWSFDGHYLASCGRDKTIQVYEHDDDLDFQSVGILTGHGQDVKHVKWHPNRNLLFSSSYDNLVKCWGRDDSIDEWINKYTMSAHESTVWCKSNHN